MAEPPQETLAATRQFYNRISKVYDALSDSSESKPRERGLAMLDIQPGAKVLEIGYGTGGALASMAGLVGAGGRVTGIDISDGMEKVAQERLRKDGIAERVDLLIGDARKLEFGDGSFDRVFCSFTLELFADEDIPQVLAEIRRVLKPQGKLAVVSLRAEDPARRPQEFYVWLHRHFPHFIDCRPIHVERDVAAAGFKVDHAEHTAIWGLPVCTLVAMKT